MNSPCDNCQALAYFESKKETKKVPLKTMRIAWQAFGNVSSPDPKKFIESEFKQLSSSFVTEGSPQDPGIKALEALIAQARLEGALGMPEKCSGIDECLAQMEGFKQRVLAAKLEVPEHLDSVAIALLKEKNGNTVNRRLV